MLEDIYTLEEASNKWGIKYVTLKQRFYRGVEDQLTKEIDYKRSGKIYLVTRPGMIKLYGLPKGEKREAILTGLMDIEEAAQKLGIKIGDIKDINNIFQKCLKANNSKLHRSKFKYKDPEGIETDLEIKVIEDGYLIRVIEE